MLDIYFAEGVLHLFSHVINFCQVINMASNYGHIDFFGLVNKLLSQLVSINLK